MLRSFAIVAAASFILALLPTVASAAVTVSTSGTDIVVTSDGGDDHVTVSSGGATIDVSVFFGESISASGGCSIDPFDPGSMNTAKCASAGITRLVVNLGAGADELVNLAGLPAQADGGDGNDSLRMGPSTTANDSLSGGAGDDVLTPSGGADDVQGGAGTDAALYMTAPAGVSVTLDDQPNDGAAGEGDNIHGDVEKAIGGPFDDQLQGNPGANWLDGGGGADTIDGGGGADTLLGQTGNDTLRAQDGEADTVDCGDDSDTVQADWNDALTACESVSATSAPAETPAPPAAGPLAPQVLAATIASRFKAGSSTIVKHLTVRGAPLSASIAVSCSGRKKGCPFKSKKGGAALAGLFKSAKLKPGAVVEVRVTQPGAIGKVFRFTVRRKRVPKAQTLCLPPGAKSATAC